MPTAEAPSLDLRRGYVYVLASANSELVKIGGTDHPPMKRIREVNSTAPYRSLGPWTLYDFREVAEWRRVEYDMHYAFRSKLAINPKGQKELFRISPRLARERLSRVSPALLVHKPAIDRMFQDEEFAIFLGRVFSFTGLFNWLDIQGAWTFTLFPSTGGGRYYTINIGPHEVAFATLPTPGATKPYHSIAMDRLIHDFPRVRRWMEKHDGRLRDGAYASARPRAVAAGFHGSFEDALECLSLDGVRRALIAYWSESLTVLKDRKTASAFSKHHNWNAVAELHSRMAAGMTPCAAGSRKRMGWPA